MSRNGSGTYVLPEPAFVPNTAISSSAMNSDLSDIADALTDSLARDGQGGMTAVLPLANTGFTYLTDPNTGMRRTGADTQAIQCGGVDVATFTSTAVDVLALKVAGVTAYPSPTAGIADNAVTYAKIQEVAASRLLGNPTGGATEVSEISLGAGLEFSGTSVKAVSVVPTIQRFLGGSGTYTTPANVKWIRIRMVGGGAGGGGGNSSTPSTSGNASTFSGGTLTAGGGTGASAITGGGPGGAAANGNVINVSGGSGSGPSGGTNSPGGTGGNSYFGGGGGAGQPANGGGIAAATNSGSGGGAGAFSTGSAAGGGAGAYVEHIIGSPAASYTYAVGAGGAGAAGAGGGGTGGGGAAGQIIVEEYY